MAGVVYAIVATIGYLNEFVRQRFIELTLQQQYGLYESYGRITLLEEAWSMFKDHPIVGVGLDGYQQSAVSGAVYSHNLIMQVLAEGGLVGALLLSAPLVLLLFQWRRHQALEQHVVLFLGLYHFVASMFSGGYYDARWMWFFFAVYMLPLVVTDGQSKASRELHQRKPSPRLLIN